MEKELLLRKHGISVHFSDSHQDYYTAYKYVTKTDKEVLKSPRRPDIDSIAEPVTGKCIKANRHKKRSAGKVNDDAAGSSGKYKKKQSRLSHYDVTKFVREKNIKREEELFALAKLREDEGQQDLAKFLINITKTQKARNDLISAAWKLQTSVSTLEREKIPRTQIIENTSKEECIEGCQKQWLQCSQEVLTNNNIHPYVFAAALRDLLENGRGKFRNILLTGPTNCGKTFLLSPLERILKVFVNPSVTKFAWINSDKAEIILLNDLRWNKEFISWKDFLLLLEGQTLHLPATMNHFSEDICINTDVPIFATSKEEVKVSIVG